MKLSNFTWDINPESLKQRKMSIDKEGELVHSGPLAVKQNWDEYTQEEHEIWQSLYKRQLENLQDLAYTPWIENIHNIGMEPNHIPKFSDLAKKMVPQTGWIPVPVSGFLESKDYFAYLSRREFPTAVKIRPKSQWDFSIDPDLFHDVFGHLPMHVHPVFADFLELFGKATTYAKTEQQMQELARLYWFTVECGLIREKGKVKVCGTVQMSGFKEARNYLTDQVVKMPFSIEEIIKQDFDYYVLQKKLFVMDSYDQLYEAMQKKAKEYGVFE